MVKVILRDFDGSETVFETETPLRDVISAAESDRVVTVDKIYVRTAETDPEGRVIYREQN